MYLEREIMDIKLKMLQYLLQDSGIPSTQHLLGIKPNPNNEPKKYDNGDNNKRVAEEQ